MNQDVALSIVYQLPFLGLKYAAACLPVILQSRQVVKLRVQLCVFSTLPTVPEIEPVLILSQLAPRL